MPKAPEILKKIKVLKEKLALFRVIRESMANFWSRWIKLIKKKKNETNLNTKILVFSILKKFQKFYSEILRNFLKNTPDLKLHISKIFANSFLKMQ